MVNKIQMGWKMYGSMEDANGGSFFVMPQEVRDEDVTWVRVELGCKIGVYDVDDLVIQFIPNKKVAKELPIRALEVFCMWLDNPLQDEQVQEFLTVLSVRIQNLLGIRSCKS